LVLRESGTKMPVSSIAFRKDRPEYKHGRVDEMCKAMREVAGLMALESVPSDPNLIAALRR